MNPRSTPLLLPVLLLALAAGSAAGEEKQKLYRWVDKQGQVHYGDSVPAEYAEQDRDVLNKQGVKVGREEGTITPEEAAAKAAEDKAARDEQKRKLRDRVLLQTYQSVKELEILRDNRLDLVDAQLTIQEQSLSNLRAQRAKFQRIAARYAPVRRFSIARATDLAGGFAAWQAAGLPVHAAPEVDPSMRPGMGDPDS